MPIVACPNCDRALRISARHAGLDLKCPACGASFAAEEPEEEYAPRRKKRGNGWSAWVVVVMIFLTILIPLVGIVLGAIDMGREGTRRVQGAVFLAIGLVMGLVYAVSMMG
jgi:hypothetical protein